MKNYSFLLFLTISVFDFSLKSQCSFTTNITASGPTVSCGNVTLTADNTGNVWTQKANFGNGVRYRGIAFTIGNKGYMGTGTGTPTYMSDFWEYDPSNNSWTQKANYAGGNCYGAVGFASATKGYVGTGFSGSYKNDFYEYDPVNNVWNQKANFTGGARRFAIGFFSNGKCYIGTGANASTSFNDLWEYDPSLNFWTAKASIPSAIRYYSFCSSIGNLAYVGGGYVNGVVSNDVWEYNVTNNTWVQKANLGTAVFYGATALNMGGNLYVATGLETASTTYSDKMWRYDALSNSWTQMQNIGSGHGRHSASSFAIGLRAYVVGGYTTTALNSTWEYEAPGTYSWSSGVMGQVFTPTLSGSYTVNITNASNCTATAVQAVSISPNPNLSVSGNTLHCTGTSLTLAASGASSYTWSSNAGSSNSSFIVVSPSVNTSYTVSASTGSCVLDAITNVSVNTSPDAAIVANGSTVACGAITLSTALTGNNWTQMAGVTNGRSNGVAFSIGTKGYFGTGYHGPSSTHFKDFWEYDPQTNTWTQKANFGGVARRKAVGFAIGSKGYIGTGIGSSTGYLGDFWEYDPTTNTWLQKTNFIGSARFEAVGFGIGSKGYIGMGYDGSNESDFFEYDPNTNVWVSKANFPGAARSSAVGFNLNNLGFVGLGSGNTNLYDFWEYNPSGNSWTKKADFPGTPRYSAVGFGIGNKGYVGTGFGTSPVASLNDFWEYDQPNNTWQQRTNFAGPARSNGVGFAISGKGYMGFGNTATTYNDFWQFEPNYVQWSNSNYGPTTSVSSSGVYTATVSSWNGCTTSSAITVSISPNPTITVVQPSLICSGFSNTLIASGATTYTWSANAGGALGNSIVVTPTSSAIYTVSGTTGSCTINQPIDVFVYESPLANISVSGSTIGCGSISFSTNSVGDTWTQKPGMNFGRRYAVSFTIRNKGYVGTGSNSSTTYLNDFWEYDPINGSWTQKANFGGTSRYGAAGFSIGNKGYIGTGYTGSSWMSDFWEYNPASNTWTQKTSFPGAVRQDAIGWSIGDKGYLGLGRHNSYLNNLYEYNPSTNSWALKAPFPSGGRHGASAFVIGNSGYMYGGFDGTAKTELWEYNQITNTWAQKASYGSTGRMYASGFSMGNTGFIVNGTNDLSGSYTFSDVIEYNSTNNTWAQRANTLFSARYGAQGFTIGSKAYLMNGYSSASPNYPNDMWQYSPTNLLLWSNGSALQATSFSTSGTSSLLVTNLVGCTASSVQNILLSPNPTISVNIPTLMCSGINNTITASGATTYTWSANAGGSNSNSIIISPTAHTTYTVSGTTGTCTVDLPVAVDVTLTPLTSISVNGTTLGCGPRTLKAGLTSDSWVQKASISNARGLAVNFVIAGKAYVGTGYNGTYMNDFWSYDPILNTWAQMANFPGTPRSGACGFNIGNFGYIGTGYDGTFKSDFWQYNPSSNTWVQKAAFGGAARWAAVGFSIGSKGYIGTGSSAVSRLSDFWEYDASLDTWTQKANFGGVQRHFGAGFSIMNKGYIGFGNITNSIFSNDFWEYNPINDTWVQKTNFPGAPRDSPVGVSLYGKGYIGTGYLTNGSWVSDFWEYNPVSDTWIERAAFSGTGRNNANAFAINGRVYLTCGYTSQNTYLNDLWEYSPALIYNWSNSVITQTNSVNSSGNYSVTVSNSGGCSSSSSITLSLSPNPTITVSGSNTACSGQNNTLAVSGAGSYTWSANAGGGNSNFAVVSPSLTTTYSITGATGSCSVTNPIVVTPIISPNSSISVSGSTLGCGSLTLGNTNGGNTWLQRANITGNKGYCVAFSIYGKGYVGVGGGYSLANDLWEFDPTNNTWTQKSNFPGVARNGAFAFVVGNLAYVGGGRDNSSNKNDFYSYNPLTNSWMQLANFPQSGITNATAFSIGSKGYAGTGQIGLNSGTFTTLFYEYDPAIDTWTQKANFGGSGRRYAVGFSIGNKGYITTGEGNSPIYNQDTWEYDPSVNTWTQKANLSGGSRAWSSGFSIGNYGYVYGGTFGSTYLNELWEFSQSANTWTQRQSSPGNGKIYSVGFAIAGKGYVGTGYNNNVGNFSSDFYEYTPTNSFSWSTGSTSQSISVSTSNNYSLTLTSLNGCASGNVQQIVLSPNPTISVTGNTAVLCAGNAYTLQASGAGSYTWGANAGGGNSNSVIVNPTVSTIYTLTGATGSCAVTVPVEVAVYPTADASIAFSGTNCGSSVTLSTISGSGNTWTQRASLTGSREMAFSLVIGSKAYVGTGWNAASNYYNDFWEYNPVNNSWTQKANFGGTGRIGASAFSINGKGYAGLGYDGSYKNDLWEYDPINNNWIQKANFTGVARYTAVGLAIGTKGYIASGRSSSSNFNDIYEYDPNLNSWLYKTTFGSSGRLEPIGFVINNMAYIGMGYNGSTYLNDLWQYNPLTNTVTQKASLGAAGRYASTSFSIYDRGFVGVGYINGVGISNETWEYNSTTNTWLQRANFGGGSRQRAIGFAINNKGYIGTGTDASSMRYSDLWEYNPANTFTWSTGSTLQAITATVSGSYSVQTNNIFSCGSSSSQSITLGQTPTLSISGPSLICSGTTVTLSVSGANGYSWSANAGSSNSSDVVLNPTSSTTYTVIGANGACTTTATKVILVNPLPIVGANASSLNVCAGTTISLFGSGAATYMWTNGVTNNVVFTPSLTNTYTVSGTDFNACTNTAVVTVTVNSVPNISVNSGTICQGQSFILTPSGAATYTYSSGSATVSPLTNTNYSVSGTSAEGCLSSAPAVANITVLASPTIAISGGSICVGQSFTLSPSGANSYSYSGGNSIVSPSVTTSYTITGSDVNGCNNFIPAIASITVSNLPNVTASSGSICLGSSFTINPTGALSYTYSSGSNVVNPSSTTSYSVFGSNGAGCVNVIPAVVTVTVNSIPTISVNSGTICQGQSFILTPSGAATYTYSSGSATVSPSTNTNYSVSGTSAEGCLSSASAVANITVLASPTIAISGGSICVGQSFTLSPSGANSYSYSGGNSIVSPSVTTSYTITGSDVNGCNNFIPAIASITVSNLPNVTASSGSICLGSSFTINPTGALSYTYSSGSNVVNPSSTTSYSVFGSNGAGCVNVIPAVVTVTVNSIPTISVNSGTICQGQSFILTPSGAATYTYSSGSATVSPLTNTNYSVSGTSAEGCLSSAPAVANITVLASPTIAISGGSICVGQSFTLSPSGANSYSYSGGNSIVSPSVTTSYTITGSDVNGCNNFIPAIASITVSNLPNVTASSGSICLGSSFTINPTGALSYTYSSGSNVVNPSSTTSYSVFGSNGAGCVNVIPAVVTVTVNSIPTISVNSGTICQGQSFILTPSGAATYTYSSGSATVSPSTNTNYSVSGTSAEGCLSSASAVANITVLASPTIAISGGSICVGQSFTLSPSGANSYSYSGGNSIVSPSVTTSYTITGSDVNGCNNFIPAIASITVSNLPNVTASSGSICLGSSFTINPTGALSYTYSSGSNVVNPSSTTSYSVFGSNGAGCVNVIPAVVTVTVNSIPTISVNSGTICQGQSFILTPSGAATYTYSSGSATVSPLTNTNYSVSGTSAEGCLSSASAVADVTVFSAPIVSVSSGSVCAGNNYTIIPFGATSYTYSSGTSIVAPTVSTTYSVIGSTTLGCVSLTPALVTVIVDQIPIITASGGSVCSGNSYTILPSGASSYTYSSGSNIVTPSVTTNYSITGSSINGCSNNNPIVVQVTVMANPTVNLPPTAIICIGESYTITPSGAITFTYSGGSNVVSPNSSTNYTVTGSSLQGCLGSAIITVSVQPTLTISIIGSTAACLGQLVTLNASGANTYTWNNGATTNSITFTAAVSNVYSVAAGNANCFGSASHTLLVNTNPTISTVSSSSLICAEESVTLTASGASTYNWDSGLTGTSIVVNPSITSTYSVTGVDLNGCSETASITLSVDACVSIKDEMIAEFSGVQIYPNPCNGRVQIVLTIKVSDPSVEIYNYIGQLILKEKLHAHQSDINFMQAANGVYNLKIVVNGKVLKNIKLIKQ